MSKCRYHYYSGAPYARTSTSALASGPRRANSAQAENPPVILDFGYHETCGYGFLDGQPHLWRDMNRNLATRTKVMDRVVELAECLREEPIC